MKMRDPMLHNEANELLPWLVNDSLQPGEKQALLAHARVCVVCRRDLAELEELQRAVGDAAAATDAPPADMRRINRRIDRHMARRRLLPGFVDAIAARLPSPLKFAVAAQAAIIIGLLAVVFVPERPEPAYTTLTTETNLPAGEYLRVVLAAPGDDERIASLLQRHGLTIVDGPSERGVATVGFAAETGPDRRREIAAALASEAALRFVQPVTIGPTP